MKIIFDTEKQKEVILRAIAKAEECPVDTGFEEFCKKYGSCRKCWENSIEIEVKGKE